MADRLVPALISRAMRDRLTRRRLVQGSMGLGLVAGGVPVQSVVATKSPYQRMTAPRRAYVQDEGENPPVTPYLVIPYFDGDTGERPLPSGIARGRCPSILINGIPYSGVPLTPGSDVALSVVVRNRGIASGVVTVRTYYRAPATAFTPETIKLIGQSLYSLPGTTTLESPPMSWTVPSDVPPHICLLAEATTPADPVSGPILPGADRHYAQRNVDLMTVSPGAKATFEFWAANPFTEKVQSQLTVESVSDVEVEELQATLGATLVPLTQSALTLQVEPDPPLPPGQTFVRLELSPWEERRCHATVEVPNSLGPDQFLALVAEQTILVEDRPQVLGSLVLLMFAQS